jgi:hypothetical protein
MAKVMSPRPYRPRVLRVVTIRIELQAATEARLPCEQLLGSVMDVLDEPAVDLIELPPHLGERQVSFPSPEALTRNSAVCCGEFILSQVLTEDEFSGFGGCSVMTQE